MKLGPLQSLVLSYFRIHLLTKIATKVAVKVPHQCKVQ